MDADLIFPDGIADEPALDDLLADPVLHAVLRRDRLSLGDLEAAIAGARERLRAIAPDQAGSSSLSQ